jgi:hypothetical protein
MVGFTIFALLYYKINEQIPFISGSYNNRQLQNNIEQ